MAKLLPAYCFSVATFGELGKQVFDRLHGLPNMLTIFDLLLAQCLFQDSTVVISLPLRLTGMACCAGHFRLWQTGEVHLLKNG